MKNYISVLQICTLFKNLSLDEIDKLLSCLGTKQKTYEKNSFILNTDDNVNDVGIVLSGSVQIIKEDFWGNRAILTNLEAGDLFAETFSCLQTEKLPISVVAGQKSEVLFVNYKKVTTTCSNACKFHNQLIQNMIQILAQKNILLTQKMEHLMKRSTREKLLSYLSTHALKNNSNTFDIPFNRQELADYLSVDRSAMSNELSKMQNEGILKFNKNHFELKE